MRKLLIITLFIFIGTTALYLLLFNSQLIARDKQPSLYKIGILAASDSRLVKVDGLIDGLKQYGFTEDDYELYIKNAFNDTDKMASLAQELVDLDVDIIITTGTYETSNAKQITSDTDIPVVFVGVGCALEMGFIDDNIVTGCNITGVDSQYVQLSGKRLEYLQRLAPNTKTVLVLYNPLSTPFGPSSQYLYEAADKLNIQLEIAPVTEKSEMLSVLNDKQDDIDAIMLLCSLLFDEATETIVDFSLSNKIPVMGTNDQQVKQGILATYGITRYQEGIQASRIVANILNGQNPELIPIESPVILEFHVNKESAEILNLDINLAKIPDVSKYVNNISR